jgi:acetyl-CoA carboxylase carboxyltransferase component
MADEPKGTWKAEIEELNRRRELTKEMGGPKGIEKQHARGRLTIRERIAALADPGTFREFSPIGGHGVYDPKSHELIDFTPKNQVDGTCLIDGRKVVVAGGDFTVRGGSAAGKILGTVIGQEMLANRRALESRIPFVFLLDASNGSVASFEQIGRTYLPDANVFFQYDAEMLRKIPVVSTLLGSVAGGSAIHACMGHLSIMVKGTSELFPGGPPVVKAALGYDVTKQELGGSHIHVGVSGCVDNEAESEQEAMAMVRRFLSYLPSNVWEMAPRSDPTGDPGPWDDRLLSMIPRDRRKSYDSHDVINAIVDPGSFFEIAPKYGKSRVIGFARVNGYSVGVMANNPSFLGGSTDVAAGAKHTRMVQLCDNFHLPLICFCDEPGFMVGLESEKQGIERAGARLLTLTCDSRMPWCTILTGRMFGVAGMCTHRPAGMFRRFCWPSASWGSMHIEGGVKAAYAAEIRAAPEPDEKIKEIEARLRAIASPFRTAELTGQEMIDPRETRELLFEFVEDAQPILRSQLGPTAIHPFLP